MPSRRTGAPLTRDEILRVAIEMADADGIDTLSMRKLGERVGVEAMSLYNHVANKVDLLDGMVDLVFAEIDLPVADGEWKPAMRRRAQSAREVLRRHLWAVGLLESRRTPGAANLGHHDAVLASLRAGGFTVAQTAHAYSLLDSYIYGFALQEASLPFDTGADTVELGQEILEAAPTDAYPHLAEFMVEHAMKPGYAFGDEFEVGLDLILDALDRLRDRR